jgi:hypothetical protein
MEVEFNRVYSHKTWILILFAYKYPHRSSGKGVVFFIVSSSKSFCVCPKFVRVFDAMRLFNNFLGFKSRFKYYTPTMTPCLISECHSTPMGKSGTEARGASLDIPRRVTLPYSVTTWTRFYSQTRDYNRGYNKRPQNRKNRT